jgi:superfamily II DNA/RNA helicase
MDQAKQSAELAEIPHIVVATPGRLVQLLKHDVSEFNEYLDNLQFLVLDEADRMLQDQTLEDDLKYVLNAL